MRNHNLLLFLSVLVQESHGCSFGRHDHHPQAIDYTAAIQANIRARDLAFGRLGASTPSRFAISNARIFNKTRLSPPSTIIVDNGLIASIGTGSCPCRGLASIPLDAIYDANNMAILPGLMDSHAHPENTTHLEALTAAGVTTTVLTHCPSPALCASLSGQPGLTSLFRASFAATSPNSTHANLVSPSRNETTFPFLIVNMTQIPSWVASQVSTGAEFVKIIGSAPGAGLGAEAQALLVREAHAKKRRVVLHASSTLAYKQGYAAGADQIHHSTLDAPLDASLVAAFKNSPTVVCPTLAMMRAVVDALGPAEGSLEAAVETARRLRAAGVPILVGTDANAQLGFPAGGKVKFGGSMHDELENMVALVGMTPAEALRAATQTPATAFGLRDRGVVEVGKRADLILVDGDPTLDVGVAKKVRRVWVGGVEFGGKHFRVGA